MQSDGDRISIRSDASLEIDSWPMLAAAGHDVPNTPDGTPCPKECDTVLSMYACRASKCKAVAPSAKQKAAKRTAKRARRVRFADECVAEVSRLNVASFTCSDMLLKATSSASVDADAPTAAACCSMTAGTKLPSSHNTDRITTSGRSKGGVYSWPLTLRFNEIHYMEGRDSRCCAGGERVERVLSLIHI